jgi:hypothetical protein
MRDRQHQLLCHHHSEKAAITAMNRSSSSSSSTAPSLPVHLAYSSFVPTDSRCRPQSVLLLFVSASASLPLL